MLEIKAPALMTPEHQIGTFHSGEISLDQWIQKTALKNQKNGSSRCFVIALGDQTVIGYYCLACGSISRESAPKTMQRNTPDSLPVILMGRLAVDSQYQGKGLGKALLKDAVLRVLHMACDIGISAILVHAISLEAKKFYLSCGFCESPLHPMTLILSVQIAKNIYALA